MAEEPLEKYSSEEWDHLRKRLFNSILNETEIAKLGQNVGISWPFKGEGETPAKYIDLTFEELQEVPGLIGKMSRIKTLMNIFRETIAFDDPFSEMVDTVEAESEEDDTFERVLAKLEIPATYPLALMHFSADTKQMLKNEDQQTLLQVIHFGQNLARNVVIGGDLKTFLNGLANKDDAGIKKHLPYRTGERGLHLAEAAGLIANDLSEPARFEIIYQIGVELSPEEESIRKNGSELELEGEIKLACEAFEAACKWFTKESEDLEAICKDSAGSPERFFIPIKDLNLERVAVALARIRFGGGPQQKKAGFIDKLTGLFGR
ncbi:MAG: hypothetical protein AAGH40_01005 [Verrucomicrobiota bacterium]